MLTPQGLRLVLSRMLEQAEFADKPVVAAILEKRGRKRDIDRLKS